MTLPGVGVTVKVYARDGRTLVTPQGVLPEFTSLSASTEHNGVGAMSMTYPRGGIGANTLLAQDTCYLAIIDNGVEVGRYLWDEDSDDAADDAGDGRALTISAPGVAQILDWATVIPPAGLTAQKFTAVTPGGLLLTLLAGAVGRGCYDGTGTPTLSATFTTAADSAGLAWPLLLSIPYEQGRSLLSVVADLTEKGFLDWKVRGATGGGLLLDTWVADTARARDRPDARLIRGRDILSAPRRRTRRDVRSAMIVYGDNGARSVTTDATAVARWGRREGTLGQSGVTDPLTLARIGAVAVQRVTQESQGFTASYDRGQGGPVPHADYRTGDYARADWIRVSVTEVAAARQAAVDTAVLQRTADANALAVGLEQARLVGDADTALTAATQAEATTAGLLASAQQAVPAAEQRYAAEQQAAQGELTAAQQSEQATTDNGTQARASGDQRVNDANTGLATATSAFDVAKRHRDDVYRNSTTTAQARTDSDENLSRATTALDQANSRVATAQRQSQQLHDNADRADAAAHQRTTVAQRNVDRLASEPDYLVGARRASDDALAAHDTAVSDLAVAQGNDTVARDTAASTVAAAQANAAGARADALTAQTAAAQAQQVAGRWEPVRVMSIACTWDANSVAQASVELDNVFLDHDVRLARRVDAITGGSVSTTSAPPTAVAVDTVAPAAPGQVAVSSSAVSRADGTTIAGATVTWAQVTQNSDGTPYVDAGDYLLSWTINGGPSSARQSVAGTTAYVEGLPAGALLVAGVLARDRSGNTSPTTFSPATVLASDATPPPVPAAPTVVATLGGLATTWSGLGSQGEQMPPDFDHVEVHVSTAASFTPGPATLRDTLPAPAGIGTSALQGLAYTGWYMRLVAVDRVGNRSAAGAVTGPTTPTRVGSGDLGVGAVTAAALGITIGGLNLLANSGFEAGASPAVNLLDAVSASFVANGQPSLGGWHPAYGPPIFNAGIGTPFGRRSAGFLRVKGNATDSTGFGGGLCGGAYVDISGLVVGRYYTFRVLAGNDGNANAVNVYVNSGSTDVNTEWTVGYGFTGVIGATFLAQATTATAYVRGRVPGPNGVFDLYLEDPAVYNGLKTLPWTPGGQPQIVVPDAALNPIWQWTRSDTNWSLSDTSYSGLQSAHVSVSSASDTLLTQDIVVVAAGAYTLGAKVKRTNVAGSGFGSGLQLQIPATGTSVQVTRTSNDALGLGTAYGYGVFAEGTNDWQLQWQTYNLTPGTYRIACQQGFYGTCTGDSWFDEIQFVQGDVLPSYAPKIGELLPGSVQAAFTAIAALGPDGNLAPLSVGRAALVDGAVSAAKTSLAAIDGGSGNLAVNSVGANAIAAYAVTAGKIDAAAVTARELAAGSIVAGSAVIGTAAIASAQIAALDVGKLNTGTLAATQIGLGGGRLTTGAPGATTGARLDLDAAGLRAYDGNNALTVRIGSDGVASFTGTVTGSTISGSKFQTSSDTSKPRIVIDSAVDASSINFYNGLTTAAPGSQGGPAQLTVSTVFANSPAYGQRVTLTSGTGTDGASQLAQLILTPDEGGGGATYGFYLQASNLYFYANRADEFVFNNGRIHSRGGPSNGGALLSTKSDTNSTHLQWTGNSYHMWVDNSDVKSFVIDHPTDPKRWLRYITVESPHNDVTCRGEGRLSPRHREGEHFAASATVRLPAHFAAITDETTAMVEVHEISEEECEHGCHLPHRLVRGAHGISTRSVGNLSPSRVQDGAFTVHFTDGHHHAHAAFWWRVTATRKDIPAPEVEPFKRDWRRVGDGPYGYLVPAAA